MSRGGEKLSMREIGWREAQRLSDLDKKKYAATARANGTLDPPVTLKNGDTVTLSWGPSGKATIENGGAPMSGTFSGTWDPIPGGTSTGGNVFFYPSDAIPNVPDQETLRELLELEEGEEVVSYAVRLPDGSIDVRVIER